LVNLFRVNNLIKFGFNKLKNVKNEEKINFIGQKMVILSANQIVGKINNFISNYQTKLLSKAFNAFILKSFLQNERQNRKDKIELDKRNSEMLRINSKV
jgi:hypothetical protein